MAAATTELNNYIASTDTAPRRSGFLSRILDTLKETRMRAAEREIARLIEVKGGRLTDDLERQIERRFI